MTAPSPLAAWKIVLRLSPEKLPLYEDAFAEYEAAVDTEVEDETGLPLKEDAWGNLEVEAPEWLTTVFFPPSMTPDEVVSAVMAAATSAGDEVAAVCRELVPAPVYESDWQGAMREAFPPLEVGSFFIYTFEEDKISWEASTPDFAGKTALNVPAGMAFGTGEHPTTAGCLKLYEQAVAERGAPFTNGLDMGCGSAILAMAAAKRHGTACLGVEIDPLATETAVENVAHNGLSDKVTCVCGDGFSAPSVQSKAPYDLIFANILANPLIGMAQPLAAALAADGVAILSGFLDTQQDDVLAAYAACRVTLVATVQEREWVAALVRKER